MKRESALVIEIWELVRDLTPPAKRGEIATGLLRAFEEYGLDRRDLQDVVDEDAYMSRAFREVFDEEEVEEIEFDEE